MNKPRKWLAIQADAIAELWHFDTGKGSNQLKRDLETLGIGLDEIYHYKTPARIDAFNRILAYGAHEWLSEEAQS